MSICLGTPPKEGFVETDYSDFRIKCGIRIFHVHRVVLMEYEYFKGAFRGSWKESGVGEFDFSDWDEVIVEAFLSHLYGVDYSEITLRLRLPIEALPNVRMGLERELLATPSAYTEDEDVDGQDPPIELARFHLHELANHVKVFAMADHYDLKGLMVAAEVAFGNVLCDCWNAPGILKVVFLTFQPTASQELEETLVKELAYRTSMLGPSKLFHTLLEKVPRCAAMVLLRTADWRRANFHHTDPKVRYCTYWSCRRNVLSCVYDEDGDDEDEMCSNCEFISYLQPARQRLWDEKYEMSWEELMEEHNPGDVMVEERAVIYLSDLE